MFSVGDLKALEDLWYERTMFLIEGKKRFGIEAYTKAFDELVTTFEINDSDVGILVFNMDRDYCSRLVDWDIVDRNILFYKVFYVDKN